MPAGRDAAAPPACPCCDGRDWRPLVSQRGHDWWRCAGCGVARLFPMPDAIAIAAIAGDAIGADYIAAYRRKLERKMARSRARVRRLARRMPGKRLVDIGSNIGCLVEAAREIGLDAVGVEINPTLVAFARRTYPAARFVEGAIERADLPAGGFDGVYCSEVIEHVPEQAGFVAALARLVAPGGALYLTTPGLHEYVGRGDPAGWRDFGAPDHKIYHTRRSLAALLARHGFSRPRFSLDFWNGHKLFATRQ
jgi:SAM-dependent methyltransferase